MDKIVAREVNPSHVDFSFYFDDDGLKSISGENCACYIPGDRRHCGFNNDEYMRIKERAERIVEGFHEVSEKWTNGYNSYATFKECMTYNGIAYTSLKKRLKKAFARTATHLMASVATPRKS